MVVLVAWAVAVFVALLVCAALALGLRGHLARLARATRAAESDMVPTLDALRRSRSAIGTRHAG
ncbi:MAG TPA: hypothetical protein VIS06_05475 [Mycobacteriales bacterium]|jgi:hypothetical protein